jgi:hypothetical protein
MKTILALVTSFLISINCFSQSIEISRATKIAENFIITNDLDISLSEEITNIQESIDSDKLLAYVFFGENRGYIIVSADKLLTPVISYSTTGHYQKESPLESLIRKDLSSRIKNIDTQSASAKEKIYASRKKLFSDNATKETINQWPEEGTTSTGGWTETTWNQTHPYNLFCPIKLSTQQRSLTGCPATAMAQILYYHKELNNTRFGSSDRYYHNYTQKYWIDDAHDTYDFLSFSALNEYLESIEKKFQNSESLTTEDIAALSLAAGFACKSVYDPGGSGTFSVQQAYNAFIKFGFSEAVLLNESFSDDEIKEKMIDNIKQALPVHLAVVDNAWQYGHNVVCDGYRDNGFFRINMGWGGSADNWYSLPEGFPYSLTVFEGIVADIIPKPRFSLSLLVSPEDLETELSGEGMYQEGYQVAIAAGIIENYEFTHWSGNQDDLDLLDEANNPETFITMPARDLELTANYQPTTNLPHTELLNLETFPNPFDNYIIIAYSGIINDIHLLNIYGQRLTISHTKLDKGIKIFTENLPSGTYVLSIISNENIILFKKLIKL